MLSVSTPLEKKKRTLWKGPHQDKTTTYLSAQKTQARARSRVAPSIAATKRVTQTSVCGLLWPMTTVVSVSIADGDSARSCSAPAASHRSTQQREGRVCHARQNRKLTMTISPFFTPATVFLLLNTYCDALQISSKTRQATMDVFLYRRHSHPHARSARVAKSFQAPRTTGKCSEDESKSTHVACG